MTEQSRHNGLTAKDASARLAEDGPNELPPEPAEPLWRRVLKQFDDLLVKARSVLGVGCEGQVGRSEARQETRLASLRPLRLPST